MTQLTAHPCVTDARAAIERYVAALGAEVAYAPIVVDDGRVGHCELAIGEARWMMSDRFASAGVAAPRGPEDSSPAGRVAVFVDPFGHRWFLKQ